MIDDYPDFKFYAPAATAASIPVGYPRESKFTAFNLMKLAASIAAGWVLGNAAPQLAVVLGAICVVGMVVRWLLSRGEE